MGDEREETGGEDASRQYDKLVRDDIPAIIRESGERPVTHVAEGGEYRERLAEKLVEEAEEFAESRDAEELADVLEVVAAVRRQLGVDADELERLRREKREACGGFEAGVVLERVEPSGACETREQNP
ncbi:nucleoside triphosphate pyrophosphohydrolase [Haloprofundus halophilus]|uniref:nucleoside triphosphate pyrophosphohydrolase n=1 Tax=Haloprofundus halophilus TaxID=2283527 RepID=UPI000E447AC7|nr:nucleoside triphosphate pyrophosphohydrolase [Haloprofundus halophilus]